MNKKLGQCWVDSGGLTIELRETIPGFSMLGALGGLHRLKLEDAQFLFETLKKGLPKALADSAESRKAELLKEKELCETRLREVSDKLSVLAEEG